jgi:hypothetical protein
MTRAIGDTYFTLAIARDTKFCFHVNAYFWGSNASTSRNSSDLF